MLTISKTCTFDAAHMLAGHPGQCKNLHGHTYRVTVEIGMLPPMPGVPSDMVMDFKDLKAMIRECIVDPLDHAFLYDQTCAIEAELAQVLARQGMKRVALPFRTTAENLARYFYSLLAPSLPVVAVEVSETPESVAIYRRASSDGAV